MGYAESLSVILVYDDIMDGYLLPIVQIYFPPPGTESLLWKQWHAVWSEAIPSVIPPIPPWHFSLHSVLRSHVPIRMSMVQKTERGKKEKKKKERKGTIHRVFLKCLDSVHIYSRSLYMVLVYICLCSVN